MLAVLSLSISGCAGERTLDDRIAQFGETVDKRLAPFFAAASVAYPPAKVTLIGLKQERELQLYAAGATGQYHFIRSYPILAASGNLGPKLREGDKQVPEGLYRIESLNPNSRFHLALRVNYPNEFDRAQGKAEGRRNLGGDIMIHGNAVSIGCLAMGDAAAEELFVLGARTGLRNMKVILSPVDFRAGKIATPSADAPRWLGPLYDSIKNELIEYDRKKGAEPAATRTGR
jgi:murein L,D-transpeptidase YafK